MMQYLSDDYKLLIQSEEELEESIQITTISKEEAKKRLSNIDGYKSLISDDNSANIISQVLDICIPCNNISTDITPYDTLIVVKPKEFTGLIEFNSILMNYMVIELNAIWRVDYYSRDEELLKQITLGKLSYSEAKREAFMGCARFQCEFYDLYYV